MSTSDTAESGTEEVFALVETLRAAEARLAIVTGGQVDAVVTRDGRAFMLQRSQALVRQREALRQAAILDALPACVALVDAQGAIVSVNEAWRRFARENSLPAPAGGVGSNYLEVCDRVQGEETPFARDVATGMRAVLRGELPSYSVEYACHSPDVQRWFVMMVSPLLGEPLSGVVVTHFDITERVRAEHAMERSSELLNAVITGTPDAVFVKDRDGRYLLVNEALARLLNHKVNEIVGKTNAELNLVERTVLSPQAADERLEIDRRVMASGRAVSTEDTFGSPTGTRTYHATKAPYRNERGEVIGVIGISRDITERKRVERSLQESQALLNMASRLALVGSWCVDMPPSKVAWSDACAAIHDEPPGFSPTVGRALAYYTTEHRAVISAAFGACVSEGAPFDGEYEIQTAKGRRRWVRAIGEAVRDDEGVILRVQGAFQDVTEHKLAEHKARVLADRLTDILGSITDALLTLDREWRFTFVNSEALRMLGRASDDLVGSNIWEELPELSGTDFQRGLRVAMQAGASSQFEIFFSPLRGWILVNCYPSKTGLSIYFSDITQRRKDQDALRELNADLEVRVASRTAELTQAREEAEQANRAKSEMFIIIREWNADFAVI